MDITYQRTSIQRGSFSNTHKVSSLSEGSGFMDCQIYDPVLKL